jgi:hypothetical protein
MDIPFPQIIYKNSILVCYSNEKLIWILILIFCVMRIREAIEKSKFFFFVSEGLVGRKKRDTTNKRVLIGERKTRHRHTMHGTDAARIFTNLLYFRFSSRYVVLWIIMFWWFCTDIFEVETCMRKEKLAFFTLLMIWNSQFFPALTSKSSHYDGRKRRTIHSSLLTFHTKRSHFIVNI